MLWEWRDGVVGVVVLLMDYLYFVFFEKVLFLFLT